MRFINKEVRHVQQAKGRGNRRDYRRRAHHHLHHAKIAGLQYLPIRTDRASIVELNLNFSGGDPMVWAGLLQLLLDQPGCLPDFIVRLNFRGKPED
jgi:hypothetical protein